MLAVDLDDALAERLVDLIEQLLRREVRGGAREPRVPRTTEPSDVTRAE